MKRLEEIQEIAHRATMHHVRRMPHWLQQHAPDMIQEAIIALLKAAPKYDPRLGSFQRFGFGICTNAALRHLNKFRSVVVGPRLDRGGSPLEDAALHDAPGRVAMSLEDPAALPSERLDAARFQARLRLILRRLDDSRGKLGVRVLLDAKAPSEVRKPGQPMREVRYAVKNTVRRAERSLAVAALWEEMRP